jgi:elongation factor P
MNLVVSILEDGNPVSAKLPSSGIYEVESVTMKAKQASRGVMKVPGFLKGGMQVMVPEFVQSGDKVQIDLNTFEYMGRA